MSESSKAIRQHFIDFFAGHGHAVVKSSSLVPANDPTLMFTNAGMVQFKDVFVGAEKRPYNRATSSQKCMRVAGKHNDLGEVGRTARHHTLFEMLGNFSFGDYFKEEAIKLAWEFVTKEIGLAPNRLWVTVFGGEGDLGPDDEARDLWRKISGLSDERILGMGAKDNFWAMGPTGPCGPCTEIHYDQGGDGEPTPEDFETGRVMEIWNNVFMQYERKSADEMVLLPKPSVDTGMGLERLTALLQGKSSNYHTDLFQPIIDVVAETVGKPYCGGDSDNDVSMRVIADHARATAFLVADGVQPSNTARGYVMRRIMRRAVRHGKKLGFENELFLHHACAKVVEIMGDVFEELGDSQSLISLVAQTEEKGFRRTIDTGLKLLNARIAQTQKNGGKVVTGEDTFTLKDTYGFPPDLTEVIAEENGLGVDLDGFEKLVKKQKEGSKGSKVGTTAVADVYKALSQRLGSVEFIGYPHEDEPLESRTGHWRKRDADGTHYIEAHATIRAIVQGGVEVDKADAGEVALVVDPTPFYGESGGQVGDSGMIVNDNLVIEVVDVKRPIEGLTVCHCRILDGTLSLGDKVWAGYEPDVRKLTRAHHSATHLLHASLRGVLGDHVKQQGSLVDPEHLRFDYAQFEAPTWAQLRAVEDDANNRIAEANEVITEVLPFDVAKKKGAMALFGEKYGDVVRVLTMGTSIEFCGGTHAKSTADIDMLLITNEEAVASGVRRIEAEVGNPARQRALRLAGWLGRLESMLQHPDQPQADNDQPTLRTIAKKIRQNNQLVQELGELNIEPTPFVVGDVEAPCLKEGFTASAAQTVRDCWHATVQISNARSTEVDAIAERFRGVDTGGILTALAALEKTNRDNEKKLDNAKLSQLTDAAGDLLARAKDVSGVRVIATRVDGIGGKELRELADKLRDRMQSGILCLGGRDLDKATLLIAVTTDLTKRFQAGKLVKDLAPIIGGRGGGKPELAQAGGSQPDDLEKLFEQLSSIVADG
ncbi:MAG: hypothetical protein A2289_10660 [Deltaproteobacteria bacterium RIFOXYA12_FULL_58_15]|nr:MAG: hypothetical protein A2289_10660 [Deltaproteobacteria bacterium RIFOXYA12_FULL_58_15]OGR07997.1 MAG: hypothetical protein A2341_04120 [Deltaproteobacteria bacterium RIFOXYB12_FULL_58_9]